jgi:ABC-2 type transport system permease protein
MLHLVKTEWLKIKNYRAFWWVLGITALTYPGINYMFLKIYEETTNAQNQSGEVLKAIIGNPFSFPEAWRTTAFFSSWFIFIPAIVVIMLITNEYTYKTNRQNIIDGWSRREFMIAKLINVALLSAIVTVIFALVSFIIGMVNTTDPLADTWKLSYYIGLFALQTFAQLSFAFMIGLLVRKSFIALAVFTFYGIIFEPILSKLIEYKLESPFFEFLPLEISNKLIPRPAFIGKFNEANYKLSLAAVNNHIVYTFVFLVVIWIFCFWWYKKKDL